MYRPGSGDGLPRLHRGCTPAKESDDEEIYFTDASGATFSKVETSTTSPILSFLVSFVLPLVIFIALGQYMSRKMMNAMGGKNAMSFGL